ncbi:MAG TPA: hypothetical protein VE991_08070 [Acidimicrobiales bacterium]|nr:hypothetical protein [Acidimicrobiales bacterium]
MAKSASAPKTAGMNGSRITRDDIEQKLRSLAGEVDDKVESAKPVVVSGAVAGLLVVALVAYLLGRRRGKARSAVVEIRRL